MIRLFSPFDLFLFFKNWIRFFLILFFCSSGIFFCSSFNTLTFVLVANLSSFFYSLKSKSFNKFSSIIFFRIIFLLIYINFFSVFSYNFPFSSQVRIMFFFSLGIWLRIIIFSFINSLNKSLYHFIPEGTPIPLTFLLFLIELISNLIRPITLIVRLVANILAGHLLISLLSRLVFRFILAYPFYIILNLVEIFVALIQSYIFATILVLYFSEI